MCDKSVFKLLANPLHFNQVDWKERRRILFLLAGNMSDNTVIEFDQTLFPLLERKEKHTVDDYRKICTDRRKVLNKLLDDTASRLAELKRQMQEPVDLAAAELQKQINQVQSGDSPGEQNRLHRARLKRQGLEHEQDMLQNHIEGGDQRLAELRREWQQLLGEKWIEDTVCPTCSRPLAPESIQAAQKHFQNNRTQALQTNEQAGRTLAEELSTQRSRVVEIAASIEKADAFIADLENKIQLDPTADVEALRRQLALHQGNIVRAQEQAKTAGRITELEDTHRQAAADLEDVEQGIALCEQFTRCKSGMIEEKVNSMFGHTRFALFRRQVNGELAEICEATCNGVPYADLNTAAKINVGLDIISTLSRHYGVSVPIFIDNAESITHLIPTEAQVIRWWSPIMIKPCA